MVPMPLALTGEYIHPEPGDYSHVLIRLNGRPLLKIDADFVATYEPDSKRIAAVQQAVTDFVADLVEHTVTAVPPQ